MRHFADPDFWEAYRQLPAPVRRQADKSFIKMKADPYHPSVRLKQIGRYWSARVGLHYRAVSVRHGDEFIWFWIGSHAEYDRFTG